MHRAMDMKQNGRLRERAMMLTLTPGHKHSLLEYNLLQRSVIEGKYLKMAVDTCFSSLRGKLDFLFANAATKPS